MTPKKKRLPVRPQEKDPRWEKALGFLLAGNSPIDSCKKAGFAESFVYSSATTKLKALVVSKAQELLDGYKGQALANLFPIGEGERKLAQYLADNPQELSKNAAILKQIKQAAGALAQDTQATQTLIQVGELKALIQVAVPDVVRKSESMIEGKK